MLFDQSVGLCACPPSEQCSHQGGMWCCLWAAGAPADPCVVFFQMERIQMDPNSATIGKEKLHIPKMRTFPASPVAPIHRKAKLLTRCPLRGAVAVEVANFLALVMVEDEMR